MIRLVTVFDPSFNDLPPVVTEYADDALEAIRREVALLIGAIDVSSFSVQRVSEWWPATWQQVTAGCEVQGDDGKTWVVARGLSDLSPHEVEVYEFGRPENRFTFTPQYGQPVQARLTQEASMRALLMTELGARLIDDGQHS